MTKRSSKGKDSWKKLGMDLAKEQCRIHMGESCRQGFAMVEDRMVGNIRTCVTCRARALKRASRKKGGAK